MNTHTYDTPEIEFDQNGLLRIKSGSKFERLPPRCSKHSWARNLPPVEYHSSPIRTVLPPPVEQVLHYAEVNLLDDPALTSVDQMVQIEPFIILEGHACVIDDICQQFNLISFPIIHDNAAWFVDPRRLHPEVEFDHDDDSILATGYCNDSYSAPPSVMHHRDSFHQTSCIGCPLPFDVACQCDFCCIAHPISHLLDKVRNEHYCKSDVVKLHIKREELEVYSPGALFLRELTHNIPLKFTRKVIVHSIYVFHNGREVLSNPQTNADFMLRAGLSHFAPMPWVRPIVELGESKKLARCLRLYVWEVGLRNYSVKSLKTLAYQAVCNRYNIARLI